MTAPERRLGARDWAGLAAMMAGMFIAILDIQIVAASLADIRAGLSAGPDEGSWVQTSYLIAEVVMIPFSSWLSRLLSTRVLFAASALGFTLFSLACAGASSMEAMIVWRAAQGFVGGAMIPTVFAAVFLMFTGARQMRMSMLLGLFATMAPTVGPSLGGWITSAYSWHWLFLVNVPLGLAIAATVWRCVALDRPDRSLWRRLDLPGVAAMALFLGALQFVLEEGNRWGWLEDDRIVLSCLLCAAGGVVFFWRMLTRPDPVVELRAFADMNFAIGALLSFLLGIALYGSSYIVPMFLSRVRAYDSLQIGETMFVAGAAMFAVTPLAGWLTQLLDQRLVVAFGLALLGASLWWMGTLSVESGFGELLLPQALRGAAILFVMLPTNQIALGRLPEAALRNASALYNLTRNLGGAVGLAAIDAVVRWRMALHTLHLREQVTWSRPAAPQALDELTRLLAAANSADAPRAALARLAGLVQRQALTLSCNDVLLLMGASFLLALPLVLLAARPARRPAATKA